MVLIFNFVGRDQVEGSGRVSLSSDTMNGPWVLAADGTAKDPKAFQQALRQDADKMAELEQVGRASALRTFLL